MPLTREQIRHIATLARLNITENEIAKLTHELTIILDYVAQLHEVSGGVGEVAATFEGDSHGRSDKARASLPVRETLGSAPESEGAYFRVPKVIG